MGFLTFFMVKASEFPVFAALLRKLESVSIWVAESKEHAMEEEDVIGAYEDARRQFGQVGFAK